MFLTSFVESIRIEGSVVARDKMLVHGTRVLGAFPGVGVVVVVLGVGMLEAGWM